MALLADAIEIVRKCPKCGSEDVRVEFIKTESSKRSLITRRFIECDSCGYKG